MEINLETADKQYDIFKLDKSMEILKTMLSIDTLPEKTRVRALKRLAFQSWKYNKDYDYAKELLLQVDSIKPESFATYILLSRMEREANHFDLSLNAAQKSLSLSPTDLHKSKAIEVIAQTVYANAVQQINSNTPVDKILLQQTSDQLSALLQNNVGMAEPSKLLLGIALINYDGERALQAWKSYFYIQNMEDAYPYIKPTALQMQKVCEQLDCNQPDLETQTALIKALANSRFYTFIPTLVRQTPYVKSYPEEVNDYIAYANYLKEVKSNTDEYYRTIAIGTEDEDNYKEWLNNRNKQLWEELSFTNNQDYNRNDFTKATEEHFGTYGFIGNTGSYSGFNLCLGHIVNRSKATVNQYGFEPEFTYTEVDMMTSNTFPSWYWEGKMSGGWATDKEIIRVREAYLNRPFSEWNSINDSAKSQALIQMNQEYLNEPMNNDIVKLAPSIERKLNFDASRDLYQQLYDQGLRGSDLKLAFLSAFKQYRQEASILAHEGRHSIERKYMPEEFEKWDNEEREYHAKLSQIIFANEPRYELAGMISDIGESAHGRANQRILDIAMDYIRQNNSQIEGYSNDKSEMQQLHLLTIDQIKEAFMKADPLYQQ